MHLIAGGDSGGAKTHLLHLLEQLNKTDEITLLCLGDGSLPREAANRGVDTWILPRDFSRALRLVKDIGKKADILHCHGARANLTGALAKGTLTCPVISTIHSDHRLDYLGRPLAALSYGTLNGWALRQMDALVCVSETMAARYERRGFPRRRLHPIYNGADFAAPRVTVDRQNYFASWDIPAAPEDVIIGAAARLDPVKDLPTLLRGFAMAAAREPRLKLVLAGAGPEEGKLRALAGELKLENRVFFPGWLEDAESFFAAVDAVALSSRSETFPYVLLDAARYEIPAVATAVGGIPALLEDGVNGFLFAPGDTAALAEALLRLTDDALRRRMGRALGEKAAADFSLEAMAARQRQIYLSILAGN